MKSLRAPVGRSDRGFVMVALLIGMSVAAIWMAAALPAWRQQTQRQREEDLIFRGEQYARAIVLFQDKNRGALPPSIDVLVSGHYLRKKWKDPITNDEFIPLGNGVGVPGTGSSQLPGSTSGTGQTPARGGQPVSGQTPARGGSPTGSVPGASQQGQSAGITGVRSKSTATSIKLYQNQQQYSLWPFDAAIIRQRMGRLPQAQQPGGNQPGGRPGGPGTQGTQPGRGGQQIGPGGMPGRGGGDSRPAGPPGGAGPGRAGGSF